MKRRGVASPEQVEMMVRVLNAYCNHAGIADRAAEREYIAALIFAHYESGVETDDGLMAALLSNELRRTG